MQGHIILQVTLCIDAHELALLFLFAVSESDLRRMSDTVDAISQIALSALLYDEHFLIGKLNAWRPYFLQCLGRQLSGSHGLFQVLH